MPPSLIIAPSSIVDHWYYEIHKYLDPSIMKPFVFSSKNCIEGIIFTSVSLILLDKYLLL